MLVEYDGARPRRPEQWVLKLVDWAGARVLAAGRTRLRLDVPTGNVPLRSFYERLGFAHCGDAEGDHPEPDGSTTHWITSRYERIEEKEPRG